MAELYSLPDGWEWKKLENISKKIFAGGDKPDKVSEFKTDELNIPIYANAVKNNGLYGYSNIYKVDEECITISARGTIGFTVVRNEKFFPIVRLIVLIPNEQVLSKILKYYLDYELVENTGSSIPQLTVPTVKELFFPLPPLEEQKRIVAKLDILFEKIDKAIDLHQKNIDEADIFMASVLNDVFVELEEKYGLIKINDVVVKTKNKNPLNEKDTPFTYIDISSIDNKSFKIVEPKQLIGSEAPSRAKKEVFQGDIVYSTTRPNLKNIAIVSENYNNPIASTGFCVLRTNEKTINSYLFYFLITEKLFEQIEPNIRGAQYPATSDNDLKNCNIPNTPYETQQKVVSYLDEISNKMEKIKNLQKKKMQSLKELKASILDKAFKGEL